VLGCLWWQPIDAAPKKRVGTRPTTPAAAPAQPAPAAPVSPPGEEAAETVSAPSPSPPAVAVREESPAEVPSEKVSARVEADGWRFERIVVAFEPFFESSRLNGEQRIAQTRQDESFNYGSASPWSVSAALLAHRGGRFRLGPGLRIFGNYSAAQPEFRFGFLTEAYAQGEYALPAFEQFEAVFGARLGVALLFPNGDFAEEIRRLQSNGVNVWSVPRVGWLGALSLGLRRPLGDRIALRFDVIGQMEQLFLFLHSQTVGDLRIRKAWNTYTLRLSFALGVELRL
jgi:hypothetical protein